MLKYKEYAVTLAEFPDEISLCINISNCPNNCDGCHSPYLKENEGILLSETILDELINNNNGISCVGFMGGDSKPSEVLYFARHIKTKYPKLKVGWYSGKDQIHQCISLNIHNFDYIKIGHYDKVKGPLNNPNTNQRMYKVESNKDDVNLIDITYKFLKQQ